jgi:hypothetical protein
VSIERKMRPLLSGDGISPNNLTMPFHTLELRLAYSTALLVAQQRFPVPLSLSLRYIDRLAGTNNRLRTRSLGFILAGSF